MNADILLKYFDRISEAPDAIPRLRRFILDLAVRGKLVEQDPQDEPASKLLKRIQAEKARLVKSGKLRKLKELEFLADDDMPFTVPSLWAATRLGVVYDVRDGTHDTPKYVDDGYPLVTSKNLSSGRLSFEDAKFIAEKDHKQISLRSLVERDDILLAMIGSIGNPVIVDTDREFSIKNVALFKYIDRSSSHSGYLCLFLKNAAAEMQSLATGGLQPFVSLGFLRNYPFPLPPLAEQQRIVAKVDELMALCDQLEATRNEREARRQRLTAASLQRLNQPADAAALRTDVRFHLDNLTRLTTRPEQIKQLRQMILNLAVRGCLVAQDPNDEPVNLPIPLNDELSKMLPARWRNVRLADLLAEDTRNGFSRRPDDAPDGIPILRISAGTIRRDGVVAEEEHKFIGGIDPKTRAQYGLKPGDLLACRFNGNKASVGRLTIFNDYLGIRPIYPDKLIRIRVASQLSVSAFLRLAGDTDIVRNDVEAACATTVGNWGISASKLKGIRFPLPPLAEQHRIVARVDELMALCDQLETQLTTTATDSRRLLEAVLRDALHPIKKRVA